MSGIFLAGNDHGNQRRERVAADRERRRKWSMSTARPLVFYLFTAISLAKAASGEKAQVPGNAAGSLQKAVLPQLRDKRTWQALKGLQYGGKTSHDGAVAIGVGPDGSVLIVGNTAPMNGSVSAWGNTTPGARLGGRDVFLARLTKWGDLAWIRRAGSKDDDEAHAIAVTKHAVYVCGATQGDIGGPNQGGRDIFVAKYSLTGQSLWGKPVQLGSDKDDICRSIAVSDPDVESPVIFLSGRTAGSLLASAAAPLATQQTHRFVAKLMETSDTQSTTVNAVKIVRVLQRGTLATNSGDILRTAPDGHLYLVSNQYDAVHSGDSKASSVIEVLDQDALLIHHTQSLRDDSGVSFYATSASVMPGTGDLFVGGVAHGSDGGFCVAKYSPTGVSPRAPTGRQAWGVRLGTLLKATPGNPLQRGLQRLAIAADPDRGVVHVCGMKDKFFASDVQDGSGLISAPFAQLWAANGSVVLKTTRANHFPAIVEEIADVAIVPFVGDSGSGGGGIVVYVGSVGGTATESVKVLVGSVGSARYASHGRGRSIQSSTSLEVTGSSASDEGSGGKQEDDAGTAGVQAARGGGNGLGVVGGAAVGVSAVGGAFLVAVAVALATRPSGRRLDDGGFDDASAAAALTALGRTSGKIGGSSAPQ
jgi:hypothetical protein